MIRIYGALILQGFQYRVTSQMVLEPLWFSLEEHFHRYSFCCELVLKTLLVVNVVYKYLGIERSVSIGFDFFFFMALDSRVMIMVSPHALYHSALADINIFKTRLSGVSFKMESHYLPVNCQLPVF